MSNDIPPLPDVLGPSYETLRKLALETDKKEITRGRHGSKAAKRLHAPRGAGVLTRYPLERIEIDHFLLDVYVRVPLAGGEFYQRPWLTVAVDHYSGVVLGYHLSLAPPAATTVLMVLRRAILPKGEFFK